MIQSIGVLTSGGDTPGLNAALRGIGKTAQGQYGIQMIGFKDGFRGLVENRFIRMNRDVLSGILTIGGTILGTSRDKPHRMVVGGKTLDMTDAIIENYQSHHLDALICIGGGGTQKNANRLRERGLNIITLPKTIDNDVAGTDTSFGFDTALGIATEAIDRLHSTAHSHHRIIVVEMMGHQAGWLALGAGLAGGADVILIPEIPYSVDKAADAIVQRYKSGKQFSIVAVAEGAMNQNDAEELRLAEQEKKDAGSKEGKKAANQRLSDIYERHEGNTIRLSRELETLTGLESRVTILGHLQRGGTPSAADRMLATRLGTTCAEWVHEEKFGIMLAVRGDDIVPVPLEEVAGKRKIVPADHPWIRSAKNVGTCFGD
jgi:phosphofructokinase-like protein